MSRDLSEMLVSLALGALVIAGGLQMHTAFTRQGEKQKERAEAQQALRVGMRLVAAAVRNAGAGGRVVDNDEGQCPGSPTSHPPLAWAGGTLTLTGARTRFVVDGRGLDLRILAGSGLAVGDRVQIVTSDGACTREISGPIVDGAVPHEPVAGCFNPAPANDHCLQKCDKCSMYRLRTTEFRVQSGHLMMSTGGPFVPVADVDSLEVIPLCARESCDVPQAVRITLGAHGASLSEVIALRNVS
jgi:hypothetical protein